MGFIGLGQVIHPKGGMTGEHHVKAYSDAHTEMTTIQKGIYNTHKGNTLILNICMQFQW